MRSVLHSLAIYLGDHPIARLNRPAGPLVLPAADAKKLSQMLRQALLENQAGFRLNASIGGLPPLDLQWVTAGTIAGVGIWSRERAASCVSLVLSGLEEARERGEALAILAARRLPVPRNINARLDQHKQRPLLINVFYNLPGMLDPVIGTVSPLLALTFFKSLGLDVEETE